MDKIITIKQISSNRAILRLEGVSNFPLHVKDLYFCSPENSVSFFPTIEQIETNKFSLFINVESANCRYPINTGNYYLCSKSNTKIRSLLSPELHAIRDYEEWNFNISIIKTQNHKIQIACKEDLDTGDFYVEVLTKLPKPKKSRVQKFKDSATVFLSDLRESCFKNLFSFFSMFYREMGNKILFTSGSRAEIGGNEEFIYKRMVERGLDKKYKICFDFRSSINDHKKIFQSISFVRKLATSNVIILDDYYPQMYICDFKPSVKIFQVWHACGAFKTVGLERLNKKGAPALNTRVHKCYTHVPVSSELSARHNQEAFGIDYDCFYPIGVPRTDIFFDQDYKNRIIGELTYKYPQLASYTKIITYAPTFRGDNAGNAYFPMDKIDLNKWGAFCKQHNYFLLIKMHPFVTEKVVIPDEYKDWLLDVGDYREINDLLFITDLLITDYSSVIYEYSLLKKPMIFYAFDLNMYEKTRDFYEPYKEFVPGKIVKDFDILLQTIGKADFDYERLEQFIIRNFAYRDGKSTDRVVDLIEKEMSNAEN